MKILFPFLIFSFFYFSTQASSEIGNVELGNSIEEIKENKICSLEPSFSELKYILEYRCSNFPLMGKKDFRATFYFIEKELYRLKIEIPTEKLFETNFFLERKFGQDARKSALKTHIDFKNGKANTLAYTIFDDNRIRLAKRVNENSEKSVELIMISEDWKYKKLEYFNKEHNIEN